jgi:hypothetical protein
MALTDDPSGTPMKKVKSRRRTPPRSYLSALDRPPRHMIHRPPRLKGSVMALELTQHGDGPPEVRWLKEGTLLLLIPIIGFGFGVASAKTTLEQYVSLLGVCSYLPRRYLHVRDHRYKWSMTMSKSQLRFKPTCRLFLWAFAVPLVVLAILGRRPAR